MSNGTDLSVSRATPVADFVNLDFSGLRDQLVAYAISRGVLTDFNDGSPDLTMVELVAYLGDAIGYTINSHVRELFTTSVKRRQNLKNILRSFDADIPGSSSSTVTLRLTLDPEPTLYPATISKNDKFSNGAGDNEVIFQPDNTSTVPAYPLSGYVDIAATEGELYSNQLIGVSDGTPRQRWQFPQLGVILSSISSLTVNGVEWTRVTNLSRYGSTAQVYCVTQNDEGHTYAIFGDGVYGAVPANSANIRSTFRVGGGERGNLGAGIIRTIITTASPAVLDVTNPSPSTGGSNAMGMASARAILPSTLVTLERAVALPDYATLAGQVTGVAKARSALQRDGRVRVIVAPNGGGDPSPTLKNNVLAYFPGKKEANRRVFLDGPAYKNVRLTLLLHVASTFRATAVDRTTRTMLTNTGKSGMLDFPQLNFAGLDPTTGELLISDGRLQEAFAQLRRSGLTRVEIAQMDVLPQARARLEGNHGNGTIADASIKLSGYQRRREFVVTLKSASTYTVTERIVGYITRLTDYTLLDEGADFDSQGVTSYAGYFAKPRRDQAANLPVVSASGQTITVLSKGSLFALTEPNVEYCLYKPSGAVYTVGSEYVSSDGNVRFTVTAGTTPFLAGDSFSIDVFPRSSDIRLRDDEYPQLLETNLITRTVGGSKL